ncbi:MAG: hypothetical protein NTY19_22640, partial [Planctomycetota bacterium]|nr:hypothetical protein [Planctomycetota bacterium]
MKARTRKMATSSGLAPFSVYTIVSPDTFKEARLTGELWPFKENKRWATGADLWADAFDQGLRMPVPDADLAGAVFADFGEQGLRRGWFRKGCFSGCGVRRAGAGRGSGDGR